MDRVKRIEQVARAEGYELAHSREGGGQYDFFGLVILVRMSERKLDGDRDWLTINKAADEIETGLKTVSAQLDPEGPAKREAYRHQVALAYANAGVAPIFMEPLPNGYCSRPCCLNKPWFRVTSSIGHVVVGWRKSVVNVDWKDSTVKKTGEELFPDEDVTRFATGIHAHGLDALARYIRRLHEVRS